VSFEPRRSFGTAVALEKTPGVGVGGRIDELVRDAVAAEEAGEPRHVRRLLRAHQHWSARAALDQHHAPQDQRAHDLLAQGRFRDEERVHLLGC
jgi:hypothetical protein